MHALSYLLLALYTIYATGLLRGNHIHLYDNETFVYVDSTESIRRVSNTYQDSVIIAWVARSDGESRDEIFILTFERMLEYFRYVPVVHLAIGLGNNEYSHLINDMLQILPRNTIFALNGMPRQYDVCNLAAYRISVGYTYPVVIHMDQELVWVNPDNRAGEFVNKSECYNSHLPALYPLYGYVFRNYYYQPIAHLSHFLPLGPAVARTTRMFVERHGIKRSSDRLYPCLFSGRVHYAYRTKYHSQRADFLDAVDANVVDKESTERTCQITVGEENKFMHVLDHNMYLEFMAETAFVPCPAGNNPETFRHYEAMALGAIPLIVKVPYPEEDFLQEWVGYPGPIFDSWQAAIDFVKEINESDQNALQLRVLTWYEAFMESHRLKVADAVQNLFNVTSVGFDNVNSLGIESLS